MLRVQGLDIQSEYALRLCKGLRLLKAWGLRRNFSASSGFRIMHVVSTVTALVYRPSSIYTPSPKSSSPNVRIPEATAMLAAR